VFSPLYLGRIPQVINDRLPDSGANVLFFYMKISLVPGICRVIFDMPLGDSPVALWILILALTLAAASLGMLFCALTSMQAKNIGMLLSFVLFFAAGFIRPFSLEITGTVVKIGLSTERFSYYLSQPTPHAHTQNGYLNEEPRRKQRGIFYGKSIIGAQPQTPCWLKNQRFSLHHRRKRPACQQAC
jgi:hypothetical protein